MLFATICAAVLVGPIITARIDDVSLWNAPFQGDVNPRYELHRKRCWGGVGSRRLWHLRSSVLCPSALSHCPWRHVWMCYPLFFFIFRGLLRSIIPIVCLDLKIPLMPSKRRQSNICNGGCENNNGTCHIRQLDSIGTDLRLIFQQNSVTVSGVHCSSKTFTH